MTPRPLLYRGRAWRGIAWLALAMTHHTIPGMAQQPLVMPVSCVALLHAAIDSSTTGRLEVAEQILTDATVRCPGEPRLLRELAGIRFRQGRYGESAALANRYVFRAPDDTLGWQLLGTARYLEGERHEALRAWNRIDRPRLAGLRLRGVSEDGRGRVERLIDLAVGDPVRARGVQMARRRLEELPNVEASSIDYEPLPSGDVELRVGAVERPLIDPWWRVMARTTVRAVTSERLELEVVNPAGWGERWQGEWRWEEARPRRGLRLELPVAHGVATMDAAWERLRVTVDTASSGTVQDTWQSGTVRYGWWASPAVRPAFALGIASWDDGRGYLTLGTITELRAFDDRWRMQFSAVHALALSNHPSYQSIGARTQWASSPGLHRAMWSARLGADWVSSATPVGAWPLLHGGLDRGVTLRAQPSIDGSAMSARSTGRGMVHGGVGADQPVGSVGPVSIALGLFVDAARVTKPLQPGLGSRNYLDAGGGLRLGLGNAGTLRFDVAWGLLAERRSGVSVGFHREWPAWSRTTR